MTEDFPTIARRPKNSMLDCSEIFEEFGVNPDPWIEQLRSVLIEISHSRIDHI